MQRETEEGYSERGDRDREAKRSNYRSKEKSWWRG